MVRSLTEVKPAQEKKSIPKSTTQNTQHVRWTQATEPASEAALTLYLNPFRLEWALLVIAPTTNNC